MQCQIAVSATNNGRLLVNLEISSTSPSRVRGLFTATAFDDENTFIYNVVLAELSTAETVQIISAVLLTMSGRHTNPLWIEIDLSEDQLATLSLEYAPATMIGSPHHGSVGTAV